MSSNILKFIFILLTALSLSACGDNPLSDLSGSEIEDEFSTDPDPGSGSGSSGPTITINSPSNSTWTDGSPALSVTFDVDYSDATSITLSTGDITLNTTGSTSANVASVTSVDADTRRITIDSIQGTGTLTISLAANTAMNGSEAASAAGPSSALTVTDNNPNAPTSVALSASALTVATSSMNLTWTDQNSAVNDFASYQIAYSTSNSVAPASGSFANVAGSSSQSITTAPADCNDYYIWVRAIDDGGNASTAVVSSSSYVKDTTAPTFSGTLDVSADDSKNDRAITADWSSLTISDNCTADADLDLSLAIGTTSGGTNTFAYKNLSTSAAGIDLSSDDSYQVVNGVDGNAISLVSYSTYYTSIKITDEVGNESTVNTSAGWQTLEVPYWITTANLNLWLDSTDGSTLYSASTCTGGTVSSNGSSIGCWADKSGFGNNATMTTAGYRPLLNTVTHSSNSFLQLDGTDDYYDDARTYNARTVLSIFRVDSSLQSTSDLGQVWGSYAQGIHVAPDARNNGFTSFDGQTGGGSSQAYYSLNGNSTYVGPTAGSSAQAWVNNRVELMTTEFTATKTLNRQVIGSLVPNFSVGVHQFGGQIGDILVYGNVLTASDITLLQGYLACKWDLRNRLPVSHTYYNASATSSVGCP